MTSLSLAWKILQDLGPGWVSTRLWLATQVRFGIIKRRLPVETWQFDPSESARLKFEEKTLRGFKHRFFFGSDNFPALSSRTRRCEQADRVLSGEWPFFSHQWLQIGLPPDWQVNVRDGTRVPDDRHWSEIDIAEIHDVKFVWEPNRFSDRKSVV